VERNYLIGFPVRPQLHYSVYSLFNYLQFNLSNSWADTNHVKVVIPQGQIRQFYVKSGNMLRKSGIKIGNYKQNRENRNFHIISIDTVSEF